MAKSYRRKNNGKRRTRKAGDMLGSLKAQMAKGARAANKHYDIAKKAAAPHADKLVKGMNTNVAKAKTAAAPHVENMKKNTQKMYNAQKYSNPSSFAAAKVGERYGKSAMNMGKSMSKSMGNSMMNKGNSMMTQYHPSGMANVQVDQALNSSKMGVPQASPYIRQ